MSRIEDYQIPGKVTGAEYFKLIRNPVTSKEKFLLRGKTEYDSRQAEFDQIGLLVDYKLETGEQKSRLLVGEDLTKLLADTKIPGPNISELISREIIEYDYGTNYKGLFFNKI
jgi:hypothetical protein